MKLKNKDNRKIAAPSSAKSKEQKNCKNPFEIHINKSKFQILGKKSKDDYGLPGISRSKSFRKREKTLLVQYKNRNKDSKFIDKRIGDKSKSLDPERLAMIRANAENKNKGSKKNLYNLNDDEVLTHGGKLLDEFVMKERGAFSDEDEEDFGLLDADYVQEQHFGGDPSDGAPKRVSSEKTRSDWIDEMIAESKKKKEATKKEKEAHLDAVSKLDANFGGFLSLLKGKAMTDEDKDKSKATCEFKDYDTMVRELAFSRSKRAEPTSRLKTEEELAREERERLQKLEEERIRRMKGQDSSAVGFAMQSADALDQGYDITKAPTDVSKLQTPVRVDKLLTAKRNKTKKSDESESGESESDDDGESNSDDDDDEEESENESAGSDDESVASEEENTEELSFGEEKSDDDDDAEQSKDEDESDDDEIEDEEKEEISDDFESAEEYCNGIDDSIDKVDKSKDGEIGTSKLKSKKSETTLQPLRTRLPKTKKQSKSQRESTEIEELPYTFDVPEDYDGFWELLQGYSPQQVSTILERMIACNHPKLGPENRSKANAMFAYLLQTLHIICSPDPEQIREDIHPLNYVNTFIPHLYALTHIDPSDCAAALIQVIDEKYEDYYSKTKKILPLADTFIFLKMSGLLFPASDFQHDVMTRVMVFLSHILGEAKVYAERDVVAVLFTSALLYEYLKMSRRFVGELLNTLLGILSLAIPSSETDTSLRQTLRFPTFKVYGNAAQILVLDKPCKCSNPPKLKFDLLNQDCSFESEMKVRIINDTLKLLTNVNTLWTNFSSVRALFIPASKIISKIPLKNYPKETKCLVRSFQESISNLPKQVSHLIKPEFQVKTLRMLEPKFESIYDDDKKGVGLNALDEKRELMRKFKKERKGAKRELKKDAQFLARQQLKEVLEGDAERKRKVNLIMHGLQTQESEYQKMKKMRIGKSKK